MESFYRIKVVRVNLVTERGTYFFQIKLTGSKEYMRTVLSEVKEQFPEPAYEVTVTHWNCSGKPIED